MENVRGGRRIGAGRKKQKPELKKHQITFKLSQWMLDWLNEQPEAKVRLIEDALISAYGLDPPAGWRDNEKK